MEAPISYFMKRVLMDSSSNGKLFSQLDELLEGKEEKSRNGVVRESKPTQKRVQQIAKGAASGKFFGSPKAKSQKI
jgi:hypothetical protein